MSQQNQSRFSRVSEEAQASASQAMEWTSQVVDAQPLSTVCAAFAAGFLVGVGTVACVLSGENRPQPKTRMQRLSSQAEHFADQVVEAISQRLPQQLKSGWRS